MNDQTMRYGAHERVVSRPVRQDNWPADEDLTDYIRVECLDCGKTSEGHPQAVGIVFRDRGCGYPEPERYQNDSNTGGDL